MDVAVDPEDARAQGYVTSDQLAKMHGIGTAQASERMKAGYLAGSLERVRVRQHGGVRYAYRPTGRTTRPAKRH